MNHLQRLGKSISIQIQPDKEGFIGRECPNPGCEGYFKIELGTGLEGENLPCHCPYCGHTESHENFWTKEQIEFIQSVAMRKISDAVLKDLKALEFEHKPTGLFDIGFSLKVKKNRPVPIHYYREKRLETEIICSKCSLRYSVYGVFGFCPDCGQHNSLQIFNKNIEVIFKMLDISETVQVEFAEHLIKNALEDCVSSFDGFGREICRIYATKSSNPQKAEKISFQNLEASRKKIWDLFNIDLVCGIDIDEWNFVIRCFQKRHVISHKMGVVDEDYIQKTDDNTAIVGRKIIIDADEVRRLIKIISVIAQRITEKFQDLQ